MSIDDVLAKVSEALEKQHLVMENRRLLETAQRELVERKRAEESLRKAEQEKAAILDSIAHDFNNLLTMIAGNISLQDVYRSS